MILMVLRRGRNTPKAASEPYRTGSEPHRGMDAARYASPMHTDHTRRAQREQLLINLTSIPTATGYEDRVIQFITRWVEDRPHLRLSRDKAGNLVIASAHAASMEDETGPIIFEAHLDHPAFVVESVESPKIVTAAFRGGVMAPYFDNARVALRHANGDSTLGAIRSTEAPEEPARPFRVARIEFEKATDAQVGDMLTWDLPDSIIEDDRLHAPACDDLAAVASALCAMDELTSNANSADPAATNVQLLFTRAEEVGFVGAIAACKLNTIPPGARIIALENSRSFDDSPIGGGPIVRVGDRLSVFSPTLTAAVAKIAQQLTGESDRKVGSASDGGALQPDAIEPIENFAWQRKLMPGGACEATAFQAYGHESTCVCLPLGNYHNMGELDSVEQAVKAKSDSIHAPIKPEVIAISDFHNLVELLIACGRHLGTVEPITTRLDKLYDDRRFVLDR